MSKRMPLGAALLLSTAFSVVVLAGCSNLFLPPISKTKAQDPASQPVTTAGRVVATSVQTLFTDNFNRPDSSAIGNGWIEKSPSVWALQNDSVVKVQSSDYHNAIIYRPSNEDIRDVQVSDEFTDTSSDSYPGYPQVWARIDSGTVATANTITGYVLYIPNSATVAEIAKNIGTGDVATLQAINLTQAIRAGGRYRLILQTVGANPVQLDAEVDWYNGSSWQAIGTGSYTDSSSSQITSAGATGFGGDSQVGAYAYTNFTYGVPSGSQPPPSSGPTASFSSSCSGLNCSFDNTSTDSSGTIASSSWTFGDGGTSAQTSPTHTYSAGGTYTVTLTVSASNGATNSTSQPVTVTAPSSTGSGGSSSTFSDNFNRPNGPIGNGWIEKDSSAFAIRSGEVVKVTPAGVYRDNIVYRPSSEDMLNVEDSIDFTDTGSGSSTPGYPQIWARVDSSTVPTTNTLDGYILYVFNNPTLAYIGRQRGTAYVVELRSITLSQPVRPGQSYRLTLTVQGTNPVELTGNVAWYDGSSWQTIGSGSVTDSSSDAITTAGTMGFSASGLNAGSYAYTYFAYGPPGSTSSTTPPGGSSSTPPPSSQPTAAFSSSCSGLTCNFTNTSYDSGGTIASSSWRFGDGGTSSSTNPSHTYGSAGSYDVTLTVTDNNGISDSTTQAVTVTAPNRPPVASFTSSCSGLTCNFRNTSYDPDGSIASSSWDFGNGSRSSATNPSYTYSSAGKYWVTLTVTDNGGATDSTTQAVTVTNRTPSSSSGSGYSSSGSSSSGSSSSGSSSSGSGYSTSGASSSASGSSSSGSSGSVISGVTSTLSGVTSTVTSTVSGLTSGLGL